MFLPVSTRIDMKGKGPDLDLIKVTYPRIYVLGTPGEHDPHIVEILSDHEDLIWYDFNYAFGKRIEMVIRCKDEGPVPYLNLVLQNPLFEMTNNRLKSVAVWRKKFIVDRWPYLKDYRPVMTRQIMPFFKKYVYLDV